jgi:hypothetical protein
MPAITWEKSSLVALRLAIRVISFAWNTGSEKVMSLDGEDGARREFDSLPKNLLFAGWFFGFSEFLCQVRLKIPVNPHERGRNGFCNLIVIL